MKLFYLSILALLCLLITACSKDYRKQYDTGTDISTPSESDFVYPEAEENPGNDRITLSSGDIEIVHQENMMNTEVDLSTYFEGLSGTAVFLDKSGSYTFYNKAASELRVSPCSTFKIIATLIAFESDVVTPSQSVIAWDGTKWLFEPWNKDLTITEAFQCSCVWYYRKLIDKIGKENVTNFIETLDYGNCDTSQWEGSGFNGISLIDGFWLESSLLISPLEQVDVMYQIFEGKTEIDKKNIAELKNMMYKKDEDSNVKIYGKTGRGRGGWFVGFFESEANNTYFAVYLDEQEGVSSSKAQEITGNIIQGYFSKTTR